MKKIQALTLSLLLLAFVNANAAFVVSGDQSLDAVGESFTVSDSVIGNVGNYSESTAFSVGGSGFTLNFNGTMSGFLGSGNDLFTIPELILSNSNGIEVFRVDLVGNAFDTFGSYEAGSYTMTISGFNMGTGSYDLTVSAVPLPAAALLFGSAMIGFIGFSVRRKSTAKTDMVAA